MPKGREIGFGSDDHISPQEQSFNWLNKGAELTLDQLENGDWSETQGKAYLHSMAVATEQTDMIVKEGATRKKKRKADELYTPRDDVIPAVWSKGYSLSSFIDCPMHCKSNIIMRIRLTMLV